MITFVVAMGTAFYILILAGCAVYGAWSGWRKGLFGQMGSFLGVAFGIVGVRILLPTFSPSVQKVVGFLSDKPYPQYLVDSVGALFLFFAFFSLFLACGLILNKILKTIAIRPIDTILGTLFGLFKWLLMVSVFYNAILGMSQSGTLYDLTDWGDGNPVELVMDISPALFDTPNPGDLHHLIQLQEARTISCILPQTKEAQEMFDVYNV